MIRGLIFFLLVPITGFATEMFPRPVVSSDRKFLETENVPVQVIENLNSPFKIVLTNRAQSRCSFTPESIAGAMASPMAPDSGLWKNLDMVFPASRSRIQNLNVKIFIDDFSDYAGDTPMFTSFFVKMGQDRVIGLNCHGRSRFYWTPSLAHELTHALFSTQETESWWEEGVAQSLESEMGGRQPLWTMSHLTDFANLLETRRPLPSKSSYAMNQLFIRYLRFQFGGWQLIKKMSEDDRVSKCEAQSVFFEQILCRGRSYLKSTYGESKFTRSGVLRFFAVAMTLNDPKSLYYSIPGWSGIELPVAPPEKDLQPGQFVAWTDIQPARNVNSNLEVYRVISDGDGKFVIAPRDRIFDESWIRAKNPALKKIQKDFILVLNTKQTQQSLF